MFDHPAIELHSIRQLPSRIADHFSRVQRGQPLTIILPQGDHFISESICLSGVRAPDNTKVVIRPDKPADTRLLAMKPLGPGKTVDRDLRDYLAPQVRDIVRQYKLAEALQPIQPHRFGSDIFMGHTQLFADDRLLQLARWPKSGFDQIGSRPLTGRHTSDQSWPSEEGFGLESSRPASWSGKQLWVQGYFGTAWADAMNPVDCIDPKNKLIHIKPPASHYGWRSGGLIRWLNTIEELSEPGEYFLDHSGGRLLLYPPAFDGPICYSSLTQPVLHLSNCRNIEIAGLEIIGGCASALQIDDCQKITIDGCRVYGSGQHGIAIRQGSNNTISNCEISHVGYSGVDVQAGDRTTLERCNHQVRGCEIHHYARLSPTYQGAVSITGVGTTVAECCIHDAPHVGVLYWGNEHQIIDNEIYRVCTETTDAGATYTGRDFSAQGNRIEGNYIHHNGRGSSFGTMGCYADDCASGQLIRGNVFESLRQAVYSGGGICNQAVNNLFFDCDPALHLDTRGTLSGLSDILRDRLAAINPTEPPYSERYPILKRVHGMAQIGTPIPPLETIIRANQSFGGMWCSKQTPTAISDCVTCVDNQHSPESLSFCQRDELSLWRDRPRDKSKKPFVELQVKTVESDSKRSANGGELKYSLRLINRSTRAGKGTVRLAVSPPETATVNGKSFVDIHYELPKEGDAIDQAATLQFQRDLSTFVLSVVDPAENSSLMQMWCARQTHHDLSSIQPADEVDLLPERMQQIEPLTAPHWTADNGDIRLARSGEHLAIVARICDKDWQPKTGETWWQGSCIELFGKDEADGFTQVGLSPQRDGSVNLVFQKNWCDQAIHGAAAKCEPIEVGYELRALIPLKALGTAPESLPWLLEISVNAVLDKNQAPQRVRLFGSETPQVDFSWHGRFHPALDVS